MPEVTVARGVLDLQELWRVPDDAPEMTLVSAVDGSPLRLATAVRLFHDQANLYVRFNALDDEIVATRFDRDAPIYEEDAFEIFLAPERPERYFEFEVSPVGTLFDAVVDSPQRDRATMKVDRKWNCAGFWGAVRSERRRDGMLDMAVLAAIPFASLGVPAPQPGTSWLANFYRIDRSSSGDFFGAWSPTMRSPADFHVPDAFGTLRF